MEKTEETFINFKEKEANSENKLKKIESLSDLLDANSGELNNLVNQSLDMDRVLDSKDLSSIESSTEQQELIKINREEAAVMEDWQKTSEDIVLKNEFASVKESWRHSAEDQFGIKDFDVERFKRTLFNNEKIAAAFATGHDWDHIFDNLNEFTDGESYEQANNAFAIMSELEEEMPGSVKNLHENFGISNFQRYPKEILLNQLKVPDPKKETGLLLFAEDDSIGAMDKKHDILNKIYEKRKDDLNFRIAECKSGPALAQQLEKVKQDFQKNISLIFLSAHSEKNGFYLGDDNEKNNYVSQEEIAKIASSLKDFFAADAQVVANACSSGAINGWVKTISKEARIRVIGPDKPAGIENIEFIGKEIIPEYYDNDISSNYYKGFLLSKKRKGN